MMRNVLDRFLQDPATHAAAQALVRNVVSHALPAYRATHGGVEDPDAMLGAQLPNAAEHLLPPNLVVMGACSRLTFVDARGRQHELKFPRPLPWLLFELGAEDEYSDLVLHRGRSAYQVDSGDRGAPVGSVTRIGDLVQIAYATRKGETDADAIDEWVHDFSAPYPWLCVRHGKRRDDLSIVRGPSRYDVTPHGIEG